MTTPLTPVIYLMYGAGIGAAIGFILAIVSSVFVNGNTDPNQFAQYGAIMGSTVGCILSLILYEVTKYQERKETLKVKLNQKTT